MKYEIGTKLAAFNGEIFEVIASKIYEGSNDNLPAYTLQDVNGNTTEGHETLIDALFTIVK